MAVDLRLPLRASFTVATDPRFIGWQLAPKLNLDVRDPFGLRDWNLGVQAGPLFADRRYHDYFYRVDPVFATAQRPTYAASGGFAGTQLLASASKRFERSWFGAFVRYDRLDGATFLASPLVRQRSAFAAGIRFRGDLRELFGARGHGALRGRRDARVPYPRDVSHASRGDTELQPRAAGADDAARGAPSLESGVGRGRRQR